MASRNYLIKIHWAWDHSNTEFSTLVIEGTDEDVAMQEEAFVRNPEAAAPQAKTYLSDALSLERLKEFLPVHGYGMIGDSNLVALYRVDGEPQVRDGKLTFVLTKLMSFNDNSKPILPGRVT